MQGHQQVSWMQTFYAASRPCNASLSKPAWSSSPHDRVPVETSSPSTVAASTQLTLLPQDLAGLLCAVALRVAACRTHLPWQALFPPRSAGARQWRACTTRDCSLRQRSISTMAATLLLLPPALLPTPLPPCTSISSAERSWRSCGVATAARGSTFTCLPAGQQLQGTHMLGLLHQANAICHKCPICLHMLQFVAGHAKQCMCQHRGCTAQSVLGIDKMGWGACQCSVLLGARSATTLLRALLSAKQHWQSAMRSGPCAPQALLTLALPCIVAQHAVNGR